MFLDRDPAYCICNIQEFHISTSRTQLFFREFYSRLSSLSLLLATIRTSTYSRNFSRVVFYHLRIAYEVQNQALSAL